MADFLCIAGGLLTMFGAVLVGIILFVQISRRGKDPAMSALEGTTPTRAASAPDGEVRLRGVVVPSEQGTLSEPLGGEPTVWWRVEAFSAASRATQHGIRWRSLFTQRDARDFGVDDGSGQVVRVMANQAKYLTPMDMFGGVQAALAPDGLPWTRHELTPRIEATIRAQAPGSHASTLKAHRWALAPGDTVTVVGWLDRSSGWPVLRDASPRSPLVVYGIDEQTLTEDRRVRRRNRRVIVAVGVLMILAGLFATLLSFVSQIEIH